jgi:hypothetical protein
MAKAATSDPDADALTWFADDYDALDMSNNRSGADTLRHLWVLILGLGMRESSGQHCCGVDQSADNHEADTAEAGAWQTSYDAHSCSANFDALFDAFDIGVDTDQPQGFRDAFSEDVSCSSADWEDYGTGDGAQHQWLSKHAPAYAAEVCGITLRNRRNHYGPVNRREVEIKSAADEMLMRVQDRVDRD